jgi:hypothetical protein
MLFNTKIKEKISKNSIKIITATYFSIFLFIGILTFKDYGFNIDEKFQRLNGFYWLNYLLNFTNFDGLKISTQEILSSINDFTLSDIEYYNKYGVIFDVPTALFEVIFKIKEPINYYYLRHLINFIFFFISSIYFFKIVQNRFNKLFLSFLGVSFYILTPRIYGDSFQNNKDIIFLSLITISIYYLFKFEDKFKIKNLILFSLFLSIATTTRIIAIVIPLVFITLHFLSSIEISKRKELYTIKNILIFTLSYSLFLILFWPYLWQSPFHNFINFFKGLDSFMFGVIKIFFNGEYYSNNSLPYYYIPLWILISTPSPYLLLFFLGFFYKFKRFWIKFVNINDKYNQCDFWKSANEKKDFFIFLTFIIILTLLLTFNIRFVNSWRYCYFFHFFLTYFLTYGIYLIIIKVRRNKLIQKILYTILITFLAGSIYKMLIYHPYQSFYFNDLLSSEYKNKFEVDYTGLSGIHFLRDIVKKEKNKKIINIGTISWYPIWRMIELLDQRDSSRIKIVSGNDLIKADYLYSNRISEVDKNLNKKYDLPKNFIKIIDFTKDGTIIFEVYKKDK